MSAIYKTGGEVVAQRLRRATVTLFFSADRTTLWQAYVKRSLPMIYLFGADFIKALWLPFAGSASPGWLSVP